ncbi:restriction endonuclease [Brevundimonas sp. A19_0]|uniref:restriction endonuclease n=1 Tax=Brevundimonas sp. A19_0 TaxID=2821087 RepID=UPI001ADC0E0D|nr:restriction endonuclease [Brevundimonas sp. A19_0]MBO9502828.1 restriction endonuclease [Brevundimonas sp. A19_0]
MVTLADVPTYDAFMWPIIERLRAHGRSLSNAEMLEDVAQHMGLGDDHLTLRHGKLNQLAVEQRMAFARSFLKLAGAVENSQRAVWSLTPAGAALTPEEVAEIPRRVQREYASKRAASQPSAAPEDHPHIFEAAAEQDWKAELIGRLQQIEPAAFERLCQRLLREFGFVKVEVTGRSGDGGIDGTGVLRVNLLSFHVLFQCKRYSGSVGAPAVRDFRGAMVGRTDKGLIITTGTFTADARREATRDGAPAIDLVDGDALCDLLKDRGLGVTVRMVEEVTVNEAAFADF